MKSKNEVVLGIYKSRQEVEKAIDTLKDENFSASDISVLVPDLAGSQDFAHTKETNAPEGAATGAGTGALIGLGIPEYEAKRYEGFVKNGGILLSVHADSSEEVAKAKKCLEVSGAEDISSTGETKSEWKSSPYQAKDSMNSPRPMGVSE
ncbi:MAG: DUF3341 domain-containing protein [Bdellovibrionales bacterium]|nr:DUF3341 domain-containing protein [Bdellovibrionales bacterium]